MCNSLQGDTAAAFRKLEELKDLLEDAKAKQGREDPELMNKLRAVEAEAVRLERELREADDNLNDLRRKRGESKKLLDDILANPDKFTP
jgi:predicted  nucleic acid-binding Zn-ribbon protein